MISEELLNKDNSVTIHQRNLQTLNTKLYKVYYWPSPDIMNNAFKIGNMKYDFTNDSLFATRYVNSAHYGSKNIFCLGLLPKNMIFFA